MGDKQRARQRLSAGAAGFLFGRCTAWLVTASGLGSRRFFFSGLVEILFVPGLEIGFIPATTLEPECRCRHQLLQCLGTAVRARRQGCLTDFLQTIENVAARLALILINRHVVNLKKVLAKKKGSIIQALGNKVIATNHRKTAS